MDNSTTTESRLRHGLNLRKGERFERGKSERKVKEEVLTKQGKKPGKGRWFKVGGLGRVGLGDF